MNTNQKSPQAKRLARQQALALDRRRLLTLPPEKALTLVADHPYPVTLVQSMAAEDFYFLVHAIGTEDSRPILALASNEQWEYLLDMETWQRDHLAPHEMTLWLERLLKADPDRFTHWITNAKRDEFALYLFKNIELHIREYDQDPAEIGDGFFSEDQTYYIRMLPCPGEQPQTQERRDQFLTDMLKRVSIYDLDRYRNLLLSSTSIIPAEAEEEGYRLRNVRLAEKGFLPFEEALGVYQPLSVSALLKRKQKARARKGRIVDTYPLPVELQQPKADANRFARTLARIGDSHSRQILQTEFAALCNQVIVADQKQIREKEALRQIVRKVGDYISIGLEKVAATAETPAPHGDAELVQKHPLADIFRVGYGCCLELKWKAERWRHGSWFANTGLPISFWGEKWMGVLGGLLIKKPLYYDNYESGVLYREFALLTDIEKTRNELGQIIAFDDLLSLIDVDPGPALTHGLLTYQNLIMTVWANHYLGTAVRADRLVPLTASQFRDLFDALWEQANPPRRISRAMREIFLGWLADCCGLTDFEIAERMAPALEAMFAQIESELGQVSAEDIETRYVQQFIIK